MAALLKILILSQSATNNKPASAFNLVAISLILGNLSEGVAFFTFADNREIAELAAKGVIISMCLVGASVVHLCATVTEHHYYKLLVISAWSFAGVVVTLAIFNRVVLGVEIGELLLVTIPSDAYILFQLLILASISISLFLLATNLHSANYELALRCRCVLIAMAPMFCVGLSIIVLRMVGVVHSSGILMPIASTWFVWILLRSQTDILGFKLQWLQFWFFVKQAGRAATGRDVLTLQQGNEEIEKLVIIEAMKLSNFIVSDAARLIGCPRETTNRKWKKIKAGQAVLGSTFLQENYK